MHFLRKLRILEKRKIQKFHFINKKKKLNLKIKIKEEIPIFLKNKRSCIKSTINALLVLYFYKATKTNGM
jgi:hypothetical protein